MIKKKKGFIGTPLTHCHSVLSGDASGLDAEMKHLQFGHIDGQRWS